MIKINNVSKSFGTHKAVNTMNVTIPDGCITGFIGHNGAGKTTTINMVTGALKPDTGSIEINGFDIAKQPIDARKQFMVVPDSPDMFLRLTGIEYINFMADVYQVPKEVREEKAMSLAREFGMEDKLNNQMESYSHGMRQKAIIIAALVCNSPVWILDEPMVGLDPAAAFIVKNKMKEHVQNGNSVFFSTHVLEVAEKLCDKILLINGGNIFFDGTVEELKNQHPGKELEEIFMEVTSHA
ncbi:MAG: ABC transporter ATP-binding protein [Ileibacterium sp.]|nr:ABC transporter ATP-binding protein [Ileibacterium sp.]